MRCDLHMHTYHSDGAYSPAEVWRRACGAALDVISITDHDSVAAYDELPAPSAGEPRLIRGVEITTALPDGAEMHILGYFPRGFTARFRAFLADVQAARRERMRVGVDRLRARGLPIELDDVLARCGGAVVSRAHLAQTLVAKGLVAHHGEAFKRYLGSDLHIIPRPELTPRQAIATIRRERGISIWAHPAPQRIDEWLPRLAEMGINGLEAYARRWRDDRERIEQVARDARMLTAGGSDWHGHSQHAPLGDYTVPGEQIRQFLSFFDLA